MRFLEIARKVKQDTESMGTFMEREHLQQLDVNRGQELANQRSAYAQVRLFVPVASRGCGRPRSEQRFLKRKRSDRSH